MFTMIRELPLARLLKEQVPTLFGSFLIAELFYKFHSFSLEAVAFLATWYALDALRFWISRWTPANDPR